MSFAVRFAAASLLVCITGAVAGGAIGAGAAGGATVTAGAAKVGLVSLLATAAATTVGAYALKIGTAAFIGGMLYSTFAQCEECNGVGGILLLPPDIELGTKVVATTKDGVKAIAFCDQLVN